MNIQNHPNYAEACKKVAQDWRELGYAIRHKDQYASHVSEARKDAELQIALEAADRIEAGEVKSFTIWQRVNMELTDECVAFLPTAKGA